MLRAGAVLDGARAGDTASAELDYQLAVADGANAGDLAAAVLDSPAAVADGAAAGDSVSVVIFTGEEHLVGVTDGGLAGDSVSVAIDRPHTVAPRARTLCILDDDRELEIPPDDRTLTIVLGDTC